MCGIVGYIGERQAYPILIKGLHRLEYRGYDSAGVAMVATDKKLNVYKCKGKVSDLEKFAEGKDKSGNIGIGHTRWATHGEPNDVNAHPHYSQSGNIVLLHNGIIENYASIKENLEKRGHTFKSQTDTEVLVHLIEEIKEKDHLKLGHAVIAALKQVVGAYAIVVLDKNNPNELVVAKKGSPLVIGVGDGEFFVASDASPIIEYTKNVVYLDDEQVGIIKRNEELKIRNLKDKDVTPYVQELEMELEAIEKGGYEHFMLKEIYEQPRSIKDSMRGRLNADKAIVQLGGIVDYEPKFLKAKRIIIIACGTSWHAGLVAEYLFEEYARIPVEVEYASEFRYRNPVIYEDDIVIAISQSGETADTLAAIELAKSKGATIIGVCNVVGSSIARATHAGSYTHAGPEIGVASTKAFTAQVTVLTLMALHIAYKKGTIVESRYRQLLYELDTIPEKVERVLKLDDKIKHIADIYKDARNFLYLGRGYSFPVALEGALKLKEISYIHAEGYPAAEMKHGPIALIDEEMPVVVIATKGPNYEKVVSTIQEIKARKGKIIAVVNEGDKEVKKAADYTIEIPETDESLVPLVSVVPLQLLSYHIAVMRGCNVDQPRNLAKSVTVE
ncbi:MAG: glutamine--fructose-6-phosphate transaminase (isomerizing) [Bacteroidia bacterium]